MLRLKTAGGCARAVPPPRVRARWWGWALVGVAAVLFAAPGEAFLATSANSGSTVQTIGMSGSGGGTGAALSVTPVSDVPVTVTRGHAQLLAGVEAATIHLASGVTGPVLVNIAWLDPQDGTKVLHSPKAFILVGVYVEDVTATAAVATSGCPSGEYEVTNSAAADICVGQATGADPTGLLTGAAADTLLQVNTGGVTAAYVLLSLYVSGHQPPVGPQAALPPLQFYVSGQLV